MEAQAALSSRELLMGFESLGETPELALVQRRAGTDPLGLMRFAAHTLADLRRALRNRFEGLAEDVVLGTDGQGGCVSLAPVYGFRFPTPWTEGRQDEDAPRAREARRIAFLGRKMIEDLRAADKVFVRASAEPPEDWDLAGLFGELDAYGPNTLLWVSGADGLHPHGTLEVVRPRLLRGYLGRPSPGGDARAVDHRGWAGLLRRAHAARLGLPVDEPEADPEPSAPCRVVHARNARWSSDVVLGGNGRMRHVHHGSLGSYYQCEDVLHARWDGYPSELYVERSGVFQPAGPAAAP